MVHRAPDTIKSLGARTALINDQQVMLDWPVSLDALQDESYLQHLTDACHDAVRRLLGPRQALKYSRCVLLHTHLASRSSSCVRSTSAVRCS